MNHNDSFLEDLGLVGAPEEKSTGTAVNYFDTSTICKPKKSSTPEMIRPKDEVTILSEKLSTINPQLSDDINIVKEINHKRRDDKQRITRDKHSTPKIRSVERRVGNLASKLKSGDVPDRSPVTPMSQLKTPSNRSRFSDGSSKENSRPSDLSGDILTQSDISNWKKIINDSKSKQSFIDEATLLNSIKDIVCNYTKTESNKIMKMMQELHINSQANLVKQLLLTTDYLKESESDPPRMKALAAENQRLLENIDFLKSRVEELQKMINASDKVYQENVALKLKIKELEKST